MLQSNLTQVPQEDVSVVEAKSRIFSQRFNCRWIFYVRGHMDQRSALSSLIVHRDWDWFNDEAQRVICLRVEHLLTGDNRNVRLRAVVAGRDRRIRDKDSSLHGCHLLLVPPPVLSRVLPGPFHSRCRPS